MQLQLTDKELSFVINNVCCTEDGKKFIGHLLSKSRIFDTGISDQYTDAYQKGENDFVIKNIFRPMQLHATKALLELLENDAKEKKKGA